MNRLYAVVLLGWHFLLHYLKKVSFLYDPGGIDQFRENFDDEGLSSLTERERRHISEWQRCIGCGLCEAACSEASVIPEQRRSGPRYLAMSSSRDLSESDLAVPSDEAIERLEEVDIERICPVDIPVGEIAKFLRRVGERQHRRRREQPGPHPDDSA